ncbi:MAG TPA: DUF126 domain-containing protein [Virgibacillus sp.]|nr:DUF126 domain-containing protein [Virgibacillus sp.]HLR65992.1 DUF126 domain-containing protein [Virgibacillus sp.]
MNNQKIELNGEMICTGKAKGEALVTTEAISFNGGVDNLTGIVTEAGHELEGINVAGKILVFPTGKGSTGGSYKIYDMAERGLAPLAFVQIEPEPVTVIGAIIGKIPVVAEFDSNPIDTISTGDLVEVDAEKGKVIVTKSSVENV